MDYSRYLQVSLILESIVAFNDKSWMKLGVLSPEFHQGVEDFLYFAFSNPPCLCDGDKIKCPCKSCMNQCWSTRDVVNSHMLNRGFQDCYTCWTDHGETPCVAGSLDMTVLSQMVQEGVVRHFLYLAKNCLREYGGLQNHTWWTDHGETPCVAGSLDMTDLWQIVEGGVVRHLPYLAKNCLDEVTHRMMLDYDLVKLSPNEVKKLAEFYCDEHHQDLLEMPPSEGLKGIIDEMEVEALANHLKELDKLFWDEFERWSSEFELWLRESQRVGKVAAQSVDEVVGP